MHRTFRRAALALAVTAGLAGAAVAGPAAAAAPPATPTATATPSPTATPTPTPTCAAPVAYFDLGNVLIDTRDWSDLHYVPGAAAYLQQLRERGVSLGLIINVPQSWGETYEEKLATMKQYIADRWKEPQPFVWEWFGDRIVLPRDDTERKPNPVMFERALAAETPCVPFYQGEVAAEVTVAEQVGLQAYRVGQPGLPFFLPADEITAEDGRD